MGFEFFYKAKLHFYTILFDLQSLVLFKKG